MPATRMDNSQTRRKLSARSVAIATALMIPVVGLASGGVSYALWNTSQNVTIEQTTINLYVPTAEVSWQGVAAGSQTLNDAVSQDLSFSQIQGKYYNQPEDNPDTDTGWSYRTVVLKGTTDREGNLTVTSKSDTPVLAGFTPTGGENVVATFENIRTVNNAIECNTELSTVTDLEYTKKAQWKGSANTPLLCLTQKRSLLQARPGTVTFDGHGTADQPDGALAPSPAVPTDRVTAPAPVLADMGANQIDATVVYNLTATQSDLIQFCKK